MVRRFAVLLAAAAALLPAVAFAQRAGPVMQACKTDIASLCASAGDSRGATMKCLVDNQAKLGADCAATVKAAEERRAKFMAACQADLDKLCPAGAGDQKAGNRFACLRTKVSDASKPCADLLATMPQTGAVKQ